MKILLAASLALTATSSNLIIPNDTDPISEEEIVQRAEVCAGYMNNRIDPNQIIQVYNLDSTRKKRDFELSCIMFKAGAQAGYSLGKKAV